MSYKNYMVLVLLVRLRHDGLPQQGASLARLRRRRCCARRGGKFTSRSVLSEAR